MSRRIRIEVAYALPHKQVIKVIDTNEGVTVKQAIDKSGLLDEFQQIDLNIDKVGIFGQLCKLDTLLRDQDRVEIYRSLIANAKEMRKQRGKPLNKNKT